MKEVKLTEREIKLILHSLDRLPELEKPTKSFAKIFGDISDKLIFG